MLPENLTQRLSLYLDDDQNNEAELKDILHWIRTHSLDVAALLDWLARYPADPARRARTLSRVRGELGLPLIPGPPCRS
tara:strand:- start:14528 stop:14764 length:237 start_codon:yes stop_codon:yes gene_type:complete